MITERLRLLGTWSLRLKESTPPSVLDPLENVDGKVYGHVVVTPTHIPVESVSGATLLSLARFTGVYRDRPTHFEIGGPGPAAWLADEDGKGKIFESVESHSQSFALWVADVLPPSLDAGTVTAIAGTLDHDFPIGTDRREALDYVCDFFGGEWRVNPDLTLDAGAESDLFVTPPTSIVQRKSGGRDGNIVGIKATLDLSRDFQDFTTRVFLQGASGTGSADISPAVTSKDINGNAVEFTRYVESADTKTGNENTVAQAQLNRFTDPRREITLSTDTYDIGADIRAGDSIYVYDPELGLVDTANEVQYRGETIHPVILRVFGTTWPVQQGMGCYYREPTTAGDVIDLTDFIEWETGATTIEVGALPRPSR